MPVEEENEGEFQFLVSAIEPNRTPLKPQPMPAKKKCGKKETYSRGPKVFREALEN